MAKFLDLSGATTFANKVKALLNNKVDKVSGKGLSTNDFTTAYKNKLDDTVSKTVIGQDGAHAIIGLSWNGRAPLFQIDNSPFKLSDFFIYEEKSSDNQTFAKSTDTIKQFDISKSGYKPLGVVGYDLDNASSSGTGVSNCVLLAVRLNGSNAYFQIRNNGTAAAKLKLRVWVLYVSD